MFGLLAGGANGLLANGLVVEVVRFLARTFANGL